MRKIFFLAAIVVTAHAAFTACDKDDICDNFNFSHTSWEAIVNSNDATGTLTLSFSDSKNGIIKGDIQDKDGNKYTYYQVFTYDAKSGKGTLHIDNQYCLYDTYASQVVSGSDVSFTLGKKAKTMDLTSENDTQSFAATEYKEIPIPVKLDPGTDTPSINLTKNMLLGYWVGCTELFIDSQFSFKNQGSDFIGDIYICVNSIFPPSKQTLKEYDLYAEIINPTTIAYYADKNHTTVKYYLEFEPDEINEAGIYWVTLTNANKVLIASDYIKKK